ncbi:hypothetical protein ACJJID_11605 [Microbulbifer sp. CnH-101-G]|uniref:hypothetical protein n=1 Tax=Microbulbifer sp. CnH-101-G TaxID=3243393 RepID=UPI0040395832
MNKRAFGVSEIVVLIAVLGMLALITIRFVSPDILDFSFLKSRGGAFLSGCIFFFLSFKEFVIARSKNEWVPNRIAGIIRVPLYLAATIFFLYLTVTGVANA